MMRYTKEVIEAMPTAVKNAVIQQQGEMLVSLNERLKGMEDEKKETRDMNKAVMELHQNAITIAKQQVEDQKTKIENMAAEATSKEPLFLDFNANTEPLNIDNEIGAVGGAKIDFFDNENTKKAKEIIIEKIQKVNKEKGSDTVVGPSRPMMPYPCFYYDKSPQNGSLKIKFSVTMNGKKTTFSSKPKSVPTSVKEHLGEIEESIKVWDVLTDNQARLSLMKKTWEDAEAKKEAKKIANKKRKAEEILQIAVTGSDAVLGRA